MGSKPNKTLAKRYYNTTKSLMRNLVVVVVHGTGNSAQVWNRKTRRLIPVGREVAHALEHGVFPWVIHCAVTTRGLDGNQETHVNYLAPPHPAKQSQLVAGCNQLHRQMLDSIDQDVILVPAWIGSPAGTELPEQEVDDILTTCGAYDFSTAWEE